MGVAALFEDVAAAYDNVTIVSVEIDVSLDWGTFVEYATEKELPWFLGHHPKTGRSYNVYYIPSILIIDEKGIIRHRGYYTTYDQLVELVEEYL